MNGEISRRGFIGGCAAFAAVATGKRLFAGTSAAGGLPGYYAAYLDDAVRRIGACAAKGATNGFVYFTDPHISANYDRSGYLIAELVRRTGLKRVFCGGDFSVAFSYGKKPKPFVERLYRKMCDTWRDPIEAAGGRLLTAKGNHDLRAFTGWDKADGFVYASATTRKLLMATAESATVTGNPDDRSGLYYYRDDADAKTRYIVVDTSDGVREEDAEGTGEGYANIIRPGQMRWLGEVAFGTVPAGYAVIVMHHIPVVPYVGERREHQSLDDFRRLIEAYQNRTRVTTPGGAFDFTSRAGGDILVDLTGHMHADRFAYTNGILHLTETCDGFYNDPVATSPFCGRLFGERKERANTVKEQAVDVIRYGGDVIRTTRLGVGHDRIFHTRPLRLRPGEKLKLASELPDVTWFAHDSLTAEEHRKEPDPAKHWTFFNRTASVSPEGVVTAAGPGWATVIAVASDFRSEVYGVEVRA